MTQGKKKSKFITQDSVPDNHFVDTFGAGVNRKVPWLKFLDQIKEVLVGPSVLQVQSITELATIKRTPNQQYSRAEFWPGTGVGGVKLVWEAARDVSEHNGGTIIDPAKISELDTGARTFGTYFTPDTVSGNTGCFVVPGDSPIIYVETFGVGTSDETVPMQAILNLALSRPLTVKQSDTDRVSVVGSLTVYSDTRLEGISLVLKNGTNLPMLDADRNSDNIAVHECTLDGNRANNTSGNIIDFNGTTNCAVTDNAIFDSPANGFVCFSGDINNTSLRVHGNRITNTANHGIQLRAVHDSVISENIILEYDSGKNAIQLQEPCSNLQITNNICGSTKASLFAIESAGAPALVSNSNISDNVLLGSFCGISGLFTSSRIAGNVFESGNSNWRSGIETAGSNLVIEGNKITNGSISIASHGSAVPVYNAENIVISGNIIKNSGDSQKALYIGAAASATGTPTTKKVTIAGNVIDMSEATGTGTVGMLIGRYSIDSQVDNFVFKDNVLIGPAGVASTRATFVYGLPGSGKISVNDNLLSGWANGIQILNDNYQTIIIKDNDALDIASNSLVDGSTTTEVIVRNNQGIVSENSGSGAIASGVTSVSVTHGLYKAPAVEQISITGKENPTNDIGNIWVSGITTTAFTVNVRNDPGVSGWDFGWKANIV